MTLTRSPGTYRETDESGALPVDLRQAFAGLLTSAGVLPGSSSPLVQGTASYAYQVNSGWWATTYGGTYGLHVWGNDGSIVISQADDASPLTAPGAGLTRIDIIYVLQPSRTESGASDSIPVAAVAKGVAGTPGLAPTIPAGALELARNVMDSTAADTAGAGNTITQTAARAGTKSIRTGAVLTMSRVVASGAVSTLTPAASLSVGSSGYVRTSNGIQVPSAGLYAISMRGAIEAVFSSRQFFDITLSTPDLHGSMTAFRVSVTGDDSTSGSMIVPLAAGTVVSVQAYQVTGSSRAMSATLYVVGEALPVGW